MKKFYLLTPGPTPVPQDVLNEMANPIIHHRTPNFKAIFKETNELLKYVFQTTNPIITFASSGTGAMEASVVNTLSKGDKAIVIIGGKFGERFMEICKAYGVEVIEVKVNNGDAVDSLVIKDLLKKNSDVKAVFATLCETSTATLTDIKSIGEVIRDTKAILIVDAISGLGADVLKTDEWGVDMVVSGSQKGLMMPPGLAFLSVSKKAIELVEKSTLPKYYFNLKKALKTLEKDDTPWTPAVSLVIGLRKSLQMIKEEGIENVYARHAKMSEATREACKAMGLTLLSSSPSNAVTAAWSPQGISGKEIVKFCRDKHEVFIAAGQGELEEKIFRVAHLGYMKKFDIIIAISAVEIALKTLGYKFQFGKGLAKAEEILSTC